jgi:hypothetical protein
VTIVRVIQAAALFLVVSVLATPAFAQGTYIGAFLVGDVVRFDQYDSTGGDSGSGEALGFALRLGSPIGAKWGVELEFVRPGEITTEQRPQFLPALYEVTAVNVGSPIPPRLPTLPPGGASVPESLIFPPYSYVFRSTQRRTTISTALWARQEISPRFSLVYLGGVAFGRTNNEIEINYLPIRPTIFPIPREVNESIDYNVAPMVGVEGRIRMGGQVDLVPGLRLHGGDDGWLIRPGIGLSWNF